jgi:hypothetical protein
MSYTPNASDPTQPTEDKFIETAAAEFRELKSVSVRSMTFPVADITAANTGELPPAASRANKLLGFDSAGRPIATTLGTGLDGLLGSVTAAATTATAQAELATTRAAAAVLSANAAAESAASAALIVGGAAPTASVTAVTPSGNIASTNVQAALTELDNEKVSKLELAATGGALLAGFAQVQAGAVARTVQAKLREAVSVLDFGAVGNGATNSTAAFNACPAGLVFIPAGTYQLQGFVPKSNTTYYSDGAILRQNAVASPIVAILAGTQNVTFLNVNFVGLPSSTQGACTLTDANALPFRNNITWDGCTFDNFGGMALVMAGLKRGTITNCVFTRTAQVNIPAGGGSWPAIWLSEASAGYTASSDVTISGCLFQDLYWSGVYALGLNIQISGNTFRRTRESSVFINDLSKYITVSDNTFETTVQQAISASAVEVGGEYTTVVGNRITGAALYGVSVQDCRFFTISGNTISFSGVGIGIITSSASAEPRFATVTGNNITNNVTGIWFYKVNTGAAMNDCNFSGNHVTTSSSRDVRFSHASGVVGSNTRVNHNSALTSAPVTATVNLGTLGVGTNKLLMTAPFRPTIITANCASAGAFPRIGHGHITFDATGSTIQNCRAVSEVGATQNLSFIVMVGNPLTTFTLEVSVTSVTHNTTTGLWEVYATIITNSGAAHWASMTAYP